jgi:hypothetical protein
MTMRSPARRLEVAVRAVLPPTAKVLWRGVGDSASVDVNGIRLDARWSGAHSTGDVGLKQVRQFLLNRRRGPVIVVGHRISPGARESLSKAGIGWVEETRSAEIVFDGLVVSRTGPGFRRRRSTRRWSRSALALAEALLCRVRPTVTATMKATGLSAGCCTQGLSFLAQLGFLTADAARGRSSARRIVDSDELLEAYSVAANAVRSDLSVAIRIATGDVIGILTAARRKWDRAHISWAATGRVAAQALTPSRASLNTADVFVAADTRRAIIAIAAIAGLYPARDGRLTLRPFPTVATRQLADEQMGMRLAPWPRIYADLCRGDSRTERVAEHLRAVEQRRPS